MAVVKATGDVVKVTANGKGLTGTCEIVTE